MMSNLKKYMLMLALIVPTSVFARVYSLEGTVGGVYPIVIELDEFAADLYSGWYAYKKTLKERGDTECTWLQLNPSHDDPMKSWIVRDCELNNVEVWYNVDFSDGKHLTASLKNKRGKVFKVTATVKNQASLEAALTPYFRSHAGKMVCDISMFSYLPIKFRLINMMGIENYFVMRRIYQTQGDIEYRKRMYCGSGYMAHQCCDPAVVWAYDTDNDSFYVWMLQDGVYNWWSESGNIPIKFREIVDETFGL